MQSSKKFVVLLTLMLTVFIGAFGCGKGKDPAAMIPDNAQVAIIVPKMGATAANFGQFFDWLAKQRPELASYKQMAIAQTGFDFTTPDGLKQGGINPNGGMAVAVMDTKANDGVLIVSILKEEDFVKFLSKTAGQGQELKKDGDAYALPNGGVLVVKKKVALMGPNKEAVDAILNAKKSIKDNPDYKTVMKNLGDDGDILIFGSGSLLTSAPVPGPEAEKLAELAKSLKAVGGKLNINGKIVSLKIFTSTTQGDVFTKIVKSENGESLLEFVPGPASVLAKSRLNFPEFYSYMKKTFVDSEPQTKLQFEAGMAQGKQMLAIDIEKEIIGNIIGNPIIAFYGMDSRGRNPRVAMFMELKDEAKIKEALGKISMMMPGKKKKSELDALGVTELRMGGDVVYLLVTKKNLIATLDSATMKQVATVLSSGSKTGSAISSIKQEDVKALFNDKEKSVIYLSVNDLLNTMKSGSMAGIAMMISQSPGVANSYIVMSYDVVPEGSSTDIAVNLGQ